MDTILTEDVLFLIHLLDDKARIVGGAVRDAVRGETVNDIDIATELSPQEVLKRLQTADIRTMTAGIEHGTVMAILNRKPYEITTLRCDTQTDGRHAKVAFTHSYEQDAMRRDFTVNALYMDKDGTVYDYVGGKEDLKNNYIRFIGNATERVQEDYLRILRYFRFWAKLGYGKVDTDAITACSHFANKLDTISSERKRYEFFAILSLPNCDKTLTLMQKCGVLHYILPSADIMSLTRLLSVYPHMGIEEKLAVLTHNTPIYLPLSKSQKKLMNAFNSPLSISTDLRAERLKLYHMGQRVYHFHVYHALMQKNIRAKTAETLFKLTLPIFPLKGQDFIELGYPAGPQLGKILKLAESVWADNDFSENKELVLKQFLVYNKR